MSDIEATQSSELICRPIGVIHSPLKQRSDAPRQTKFGKDLTGTVEVDPAYAEGLRDLDGYERIWLLTWLHRGVPARLVVVPPRDTEEHGVFATRSPNRPNPIGLHCVRLLRVEGNVVHIAELDMLDGTPVLDIKPYAPGIDSYPDAKAGWLDKVKNPWDKVEDKLEG